MVNNVSQVNNSVFPVNTASQGNVVYPNFQPVGYDELQLSTNKKKKKSHKVLAWLGGIAATLTIIATATIPALRMRFCNIFKKQASEEVIMNSIRKYAKEMAHLDKEKMVHLNPKTGELVYNNQGNKHKVGYNKISDTLFGGHTIKGHNHPEQIIDNLHLNDMTFSLKDFMVGINEHGKHEFVATHKHIHHIKYNGKYDEKKFLDYLVNNGVIKLKDRKYDTIAKAIKEHVAYINSSRESVAEFSERIFSETKKLCDAMGWTYWREPLAA